MYNPTHPMEAVELSLVRWEGQRHYQVEGYPICLRWNCDQAIPLVDEMELPNFKRLPEGEPRATFSFVVMEDRCQLFLNDIFKQMPTLSTAGLTARSLIQLEIATYAPDAVFVHAGVVLWNQQLVVLPGRSHAGKSTLVHALVEQGARYFSDEYAVVDREGLVRPWPRPISLRDGRSRDNTPASELGWEPSFGPTRVGLVVCTRFQEGENWSPAEISAAQAVLELLDNTVSAQLEPQRALEYLPRLTTQAVCLKGPRGEAEPTARAILERIS